MLLEHGVLFLKHSMTCLFFLWYHTGRWRALASFCGSWEHVFWNTTQGRGERLSRWIFHPASKDLFICLLPERTVIVVKWKAHTDRSKFPLVISTNNNSYFCIIACTVTLKHLKNACFLLNTPICKKKKINYCIQTFSNSNSCGLSDYITLYKKIITSYTADSSKIYRGKNNIKL